MAEELTCRWMQSDNQTSRIELPHEALMIEGIASQMHTSGYPAALWWHHLTEKEREHWRAKARNRIEKLGWK